MKRSPSTFTLQEYVGMWNPLTPFFTLSTHPFLGAGRDGLLNLNMFVVIGSERRPRGADLAPERTKKTEGEFEKWDLYLKLSPLLLFLSISFVSSDVVVIVSTDWN